MSSVLVNGYLALGLGLTGTSLTEVAGAGYARAQVTLATQDGVTLGNVAGATFGPDLGAAWGLVTWTALFDAPTGGNMLLVWPQRPPAYAAAAGTVTIASGAIQLVVPLLLAAIGNAVFTNFPAATPVGTVANGPAKVICGTSISVGAGVVQQYATGGLQPANNLTDVANPTLARVHINQGDLALAFAPVISTDCSTGNVFNVVLTGNAELGSPVNLYAGASYIWRIIQDSVGGRALTFGPSFKFSNGAVPTLTTAAGATDILSAVSDGARVYAALMTDMR